MKCIIIDDDEVQRTLLRSFISEVSELTLDREFNSGIPAIEYLKTNDPDIVFLDIEMPYMNGFEFVSSVNKKMNVIIISSEGKYALDSYDYEVIDFLVKPLSFARFLKSLEKIKKKVEPDLPTIADHIFVKVGAGMTKVMVNEILYLKGASDYVEIFIKEKSILASHTMVELNEKLKELGFIRIHRSYIINKIWVERVEANVVQVGGEVLPISQSYRDTFRSYIQSGM